MILMGQELSPLQSGLPDLWIHLVLEEEQASIQMMMLIKRIQKLASLPAERLVELTETYFLIWSCSTGPSDSRRNCQD